MGAFRKVAITVLLIAIGASAGCGSGYSENHTTQYPAGTQHRESVHVYDYADLLRAQKEGAYLDHLKRQEQIESWDKTLRSFGRTGRRVTGSIGALVELQKRRRNK